MKKLLILCLLLTTTLFAYTAPVSVPGAVTIDSKVALDHFKKGTLFLDVRQKWMVEKQGKIKNALNIYVRELSEKSLRKYAKKETPIVVYCNGIGCSLTAEAIEKLKNMGYNHLLYYRDGYPAWVHYKLPTE